MATKDKGLEMFTLDQIKDEFIGEIGTQKRTQYGFIFIQPKQSEILFFILSVGFISNNTIPKNKNQTKINEPPIHNRTHLRRPN